MKLILHHLWKDIRAQRWPILLWLLVVGVVVLPDILVFQPNYETARAIDELRGSMVAFTLGLIGWPLLLAKLIQSEPVTGSTSFWLTRPIPKWVGLLSQLLFIIIFIVLPAFAPVIVHKVVFQTNTQEFWMEITVWIVVQLVAGICVVWLATYTPSLVHFAGWLALSVIAVFLGMIIREQTSVGAPSEPDIILVLELLCIGLSGSLLLTHLNRGAKTGFYMGFGSLLLALAYFTFGFEPSETWTSGGYPTAQSPHVDFDPGWLKTLTWRHSESSKDKQQSAAYATLSPMHEDPGTRVWVTYVTAKFDVPGEQSVQLPPKQGVASSGTFDARDTQLLQSELSGITLQFDPSAVLESYNTCLFELNLETFGLRNKTGTLRLNATGAVYSMKLLAKIPVGDIHYVAHVRGGFIRLAPRQTGEPGVVTLWTLNLGWTGGLVCVLVDPQTAAGRVLTKTDIYAGNPNSGSPLGSTVEDSLVDFQFKGKGPLDREVLYLFQYAPTVNFETKLVAPNFKMSPPD